MTENMRADRTRHRQSSSRRRTPGFPRHVDPSPRTLRADDPAELLAEARVGLGSTPRDCMILIGHAARGGSPVTTRIDLRSALKMETLVDLENLLRAMDAQGCTGAFGIVVLGDGRHGHIEEQRILEGIGLSARILMTALHHHPAPFDLPEMWVIAEGDAQQVRLFPVHEGGGDSYDLALGPPERLASYESTLVAAQTVAAGIALPLEDPDAGHRLEAALAEAHPLRGRFPSPPAEIAVERGAAAIASIASGRCARGSAGHVTDCEHLAALLDVLSEEDAMEDVLRALIGSGGNSSEEPPSVVEEILTDTSLRPSPDICAGGGTYLALEQLQVVLLPGHLPATSPEDLGAWRGCTEVLSILSWWNYRYATSGAFADQLLAVSAHDPLALCLAEMTMVPIPPAWTPGRALRGTRR